MNYNCVKKKKNHEMNKIETNNNLQKDNKILYQ